tara:strand:- start:5190 stop:5417 length:228 start_codon:yes stop_codon:yes gene_type:complete
MARKRHPNKEIEAAITYAETAEWRTISAGKSAHCWGKLYCKEASREGCKLSIWSTPRNASDHAKQIRQRVLKCPH